MLISLDREPEEIIWTNTLRLRSEDRIRVIDTYTSSTQNQLPEVSIGKPECWNLVDLYEEVPPEITLRLREANFFVVKLFCSFRPPQGMQISKAEYRVELLSEPANSNPTVYDLFPLRVEHEIRETQKMGFNPEFKLGEAFKLSTTTIETGIEYSFLEPIVYADGLGENIARWTYQKNKQTSILGSRKMILVIKASNQINQIKVRLSVSADIVFQGNILSEFFLPGRLPDTSRDYMEHILWSST
jgi:hypothetical protein